MKKHPILILLAIAVIFGTGYFLGHRTSYVSTDPIKTRTSSYHTETFDPSSALSLINSINSTKVYSVTKAPATTTKAPAKATKAPSKTTKAPTKVTKAPASKSKSSTVQYVLNTSTKKFHKPTCASVRQMKESNKKIVTWSRQEIINQGYDPCGRCHP